MNIETIINKIKETVKTRLNEWESNQFLFIKNLENYCSSGVYNEPELINKRDYRKVEELRIKKGYTKSIEKYFNRSDEDLKEMIAKDAIAKLDKIDFAVNKKLKNINVETVEESHFNINSIDGYCEGSWLINSKYIFSFETIIAGGYNIQCLHVRTLYKLKEVK